MAKGTLSQTGYNALKSSEGYSPKAYRLGDKSGNKERYCTCCIGHYGADVECGRTYTDAECQAFFKKDAARFENIVNQIYDTNKGMTQNMFDAMFSFVYNCGSFKNAQALKNAIVANPKDFTKIGEIWERSCLKSASPAFTKGLMNRRRREAKMYCGAAYSPSPLSSIDVGGAVASSDATGETFEWEDNKYSDLSAGFSDVDYGEVNQGSMVARIDDDQVYEAFNIIQDASNAVLGANPKEISTFKHEGEAEDHSLIVDEAIKPAITQDEHSNKVKEDTDRSEKAEAPDMDKKLEWNINVPEGAGFAI